MTILRPVRRALVSVSLAGAILAGASSGLIGTCGPFTDVSDAAFCPFVLELVTLAITTGTTPTTYDPSSNVNRLQMAAFLSRTVDGVVKRGNRRAALNRYWTPQGATVLGITTLSAQPSYVAFDGADVWTGAGNVVSRVRSSDGRLLETWTGATNASGVLVAAGRILVGGATSPSGKLYAIDPSAPAGVVTTVATNLGTNPDGIAFDGARVWTANHGTLFDGSVSIITPGPTIPWTATTVTAGFSVPAGALFDGANIWITDALSASLLKLSSTGAILQTVTFLGRPNYPVFDGTNIWVPNDSLNQINVVRALSGVVLQTLTGNGMDGPIAAAFDGERVLVTDFNSSKVSLWKAADLSPLGSFSIGSAASPLGACSDGGTFWIALSAKSSLARF